MAKKEERKPDRRKIPKLFRAVERDSNPATYYGYLVSDDGFNFVSISARDNDTTHLLERVLEKRDYEFTKIDKIDYCRHAKRGLSNMEREASDKKMEYEASQDNHTYAKKQFDETL